MIDYHPSETFKLLWNEVIEDLLRQICDNNINYCIRYSNGVDIRIVINNEYENYKNYARELMKGERLDRHKLASCICAAIIKVRPLAGYKAMPIVYNANEIFALYVGLNIIKMYMIYDLLKSQTSSPEKQNDVRSYLKENFDMDTPPLEENISDKKNYKTNLQNALYRTHHYCADTKKECNHFDIWAYSKIFYHLEIYNRERLNSFYSQYISMQS